MYVTIRPYVRNTHGGERSKSSETGAAYNTLLSAVFCCCFQTRHADKIKSRRALTHSYARTHSHTQSFPYSFRSIPSTAAMVFLHMARCGGAVHRFSKSPAAIVLLHSKQKRGRRLQVVRHANTSASFTRAAAVPLNLADLPKHHSAASAGFCEARLGHISSWMENLVSKGQLDSCAMAITRDARIVYGASVSNSRSNDDSGLGCFESGEGGGSDSGSGSETEIKPNGINDQSLLRIFSLTKLVTSVAALMLVEEGRMQLSDPVQLYLPALHRRNLRVLSGPAGGVAAAASSSSGASIETVPCAHNITIEHLLTHTAGFSHGLDEGGTVVRLDKLYKDAGLTIPELTRGCASSQQFLQQLAAQPLAFQPGSHWHYGYSSDVLGCVIEAVAGVSLGEFMRKRIFEPLGMHDTGFSVDEDKRHRLAPLFLPSARAGRETGRFYRNVTAHTHSYAPEHVGIEMGGSGLISSIPDYLRFVHMLLANGSNSSPSHDNIGTAAATATSRSGGGSGSGGDGDGGGRDLRLLSPRMAALARSNLLGCDARSKLLVPKAWPAPDRGWGWAGVGKVLVDPVRARSLASPGSFGWFGAAMTTVLADPIENVAVFFATQLLAPDPFSLPIVGPVETLTYASLLSTDRPTDRTNNQ